MVVMYELTGRLSVGRPGSGKWTSSSLTTRYCATGPALRISTTKPTVCTVPHAEWLRRHNATVLPNGVHFKCKGDDG